MKMSAAELAGFLCAISRAGSSDAERERALSALPPSLGARRIRLSTGSFLAVSGDPIRSVYVLLSGRCHILAASEDGRQFVTYANGGFQIYGLSEALIHKETFSASICAATHCTFAAFPRAEFLELASGDLSLAIFLATYLAGLVESAGEINSRRLLFSRYENALLYFHAQAQSHACPFRIAQSRQSLAELLGVSLRTFYRYTDQLVEQGCLCIRHGRLVITESNYAALHAGAQKILLRYAPERCL